MTFWKNRNVFVTGATGLLGCWIVEELVNRGANVTCLIRDWVPRSRLLEQDLVSRVNVVHGGLEDLQLLSRALNEYEIDTVFHLGAQTIVGTASRSPISTFESNIRGTWNLLEACRYYPRLIKRVIVASSDKAYGSHEQLPYTEDMPLEGRFPYDVSKSCADLISLSFFHTYRTPVAVTRCGNLFGGGDLNFNRLIPGTIRSAIQDEAPIIRSDGKFIRDYFYVRDAVNAYLHLAEMLPEDRFLGQAFNFGTETPISVLDLVQEILDLMDKKSLVPEVLDQASHEIARQFLCCAKAREMLDWQPGYTLRQGLIETISWYREWLNNNEPAISPVSRSMLV
ncbi:MAG TPA: GDP-mannose 4,6-dehydratase [Blastocatellia bacterium]|nr:GDP-mannose 4,6-dehydratase [Blastocatellia bacterium]